MKKAFWLLGLLISVALFVGCSNDDKGNNNDGTLGLPSVPNATGGELTPRPAAPNVAVTEDNLDDLAEALSMMMASGGYYSPEQNSTNINTNRRARLGATNSNRTARSWSSVYSDSGEETEQGDYSGRIDIIWTYNVRYKETANGEEWNANGTGIAKFFDFSHNGNLFLGGALGVAFLDNGYEYETGQSYTLEDKANGTIRFNGAFEGSITYNNVHIRETGSYSYITDDYTEDFSVLGGSLTINSGGRTFNINAEKLNDFLSLMYF
jgi:hypothetical protein